MPDRLSFWWNAPLDDLIQTLEVDPLHGLSPDIVEKNRLSLGSNALEEIKPTGALTLIFESVKEPMMVLLLAIALLSFLFGKVGEAIAMVVIVAAYVLVEFLNKYRSDRTMASLKALTQPTTKVMREGKLIEVFTADVVVGDIIILSEGERVPADLRLLESFGLMINEASLTGESFPVQKDAAAKCEKYAPLAERINCVFSGTVVLSGEGKGVVLAVGKESNLGVIARDVHVQRKGKTLIQKAIKKLAKTLAFLAIIIGILIPFVGFIRGQDAEEMILTWLALTFLMVPGQPPVFITMVLAYSSFELSKKKLIVKRLRGVEILGQTTAIFTDKTGTITENKMQVRYFITPHLERIEPKNLTHEMRQKIKLCLPAYSNDPTDVAVSGSLGSIEKEREYSHLENFGENHPWRILIYKDGYPLTAIAGQPEQLIEHSTLSEDEKEKLLQIILAETGQERRVVAFALKPEVPDQAKWEFIALAVLVDPVRQGVREAIVDLNKAGITTYMVTGDHPANAASIAKEIGLKGDLLTGVEIDKMNDQILTDQLKRVRVFARIASSQKQRLVTLLKQTGECVAVIGDGVNDAPALKAANMGIAMGEIGTDLAKEASDLILTDDNYIHLPSAIKIGRKALDNFRKGLTYYLSAKSVLIFIFLVPLALGIPFPFAPIHVILTKLLMEMSSTTTYVAETAEPDIMNKPSQKITSFLNKSVGFKILENGTSLAMGILAIYLWMYYSTGNIVVAQTSAYVTWLLSHFLLALNLKQDKIPLFKQGITSNRFGIFWLCVMITLAIAITTIPFLYPFVLTTKLPLYVWAVIVPVAIFSTCWIEIKKRILLRAQR